MSRPTTFRVQIDSWLIRKSNQHFHGFKRLVQSRYRTLRFSMSLYERCNFDSSSQVGDFVVDLPIDFDGNIKTLIANFETECAQLPERHRDFNSVGNCWNRVSIRQRFWPNRALNELIVGIWKEAESHVKQTRPSLSSNFSIRPLSNWNWNTKKKKKIDKVTVNMNSFTSPTFNSFSFE